MALTNYNKNIDFDNLVFSKPLIQQAELFTYLLIEARSKFIPSKIIYNYDQLMNHGPTPIHDYS